MAKTPTEAVKKKYPFVFVQWNDAESKADWDEQESVKDWAEKDCIIDEFGWIIANTKKYLVICNQISYDGSLGNKTKIPKKWIQSVHKIKGFAWCGMRT